MKKFTKQITTMLALITAGCVTSCDADNNNATAGVMVAPAGYKDSAAQTGSQDTSVSETKESCNNTIESEQCSNDDDKDNAVQIK
ncbi:MAG: hypothetical protein Q4F95_12115 [Oscillospiraceae bacterium]|nr:hypothetical protein [Oscillospiraceae bacterium]